MTVDQVQEYEAHGGVSRKQSPQMILNGENDVSQTKETQCGQRINQKKETQYQQGMQ